MAADALFGELAFLNTRTAIARAKVGTFFRSNDAGRTWRVSSDPLDRYDLARVTKSKTEELLRCLCEGPTGEAQVSFGAQGCFGGNQNGLHVAWNERGATAELTLDARRAKAAPFTLNLAQTKHQLTTLADLATRNEVPSGCTSTTGYSAKLEVSCQLEGKRRTETLELESWDCNPREGLAPGVGGSTSSGSGDDGYARAIGVHNWALEFTK